MLFTINEVKIYTFEEFRAIQENKQSVLLNDELSYLDAVIGHIERNKRKYMTLVLIIALTVDLSTVTSFAMDTTAIDKAGMQILELIRKVGYWIGIILCSKDVIKHCMRGHLDSVGSIVAMYGLGFGVLYFLPWLFDLIKGLF
ncbi:hypothetical protein EAI30_16530 [Romboutsia ilealis]|uniref:Uncharacterized protein n=1 Tax=Romboutsia faecis TaxID=2764597 RepID=A0ABR7JNF5_9FIRM|nr:hypothetical protein [Romboutsia faecis]MBC5996459.1 hypothetical protein [Romboutsia faecis]MRN26221.1 hypothetical protein [Romboutsia ilealis]